MKKFLLVLCIIPVIAFSQEDKKNIYSGGMLYFQPGYTITQNEHQKIEDIGFGLGGILRFYFFDYFTAGICGGTQRTNYSTSKSDDSYFNLGYGGAFAGISIRKGRLRYTAAAFVANGTIKNLHIEDIDNNYLKDSYFYKHKTIILSPMLSLDFLATERLALNFQAVFFMAKYNSDQTLYNPIFQLGILFNR